MAGVTRKEFIVQKIHNMERWIATLTDKENNPIENKEKLVADLKASISNLEEFLVGITVNLVPHKESLDIVVDKYLQRYGIDATTLKREDRDKVLRYLQLFIDFVAF